MKLDIQKSPSLNEKKVDENTSPIPPAATKKMSNMMSNWLSKSASKKPASDTKPVVEKAAPLAQKVLSLPLAVSQRPEEPKTTRELKATTSEPKSRPKKAGEKTTKEKLADLDAAEPKSGKDKEKKSRRQQILRRLHEPIGSSKPRLKANTNR
jgi:hypothetical protein